MREAGDAVQAGRVQAAYGAYEDRHLLIDCKFTPVRLTTGSNLFSPRHSTRRHVQPPVARKPRPWQISIHLTLPCPTKPSPRPDNGREA